MLNLYHLQIFQEVALAGSFSRAAKNLYLSQPAVSQHIQTLEGDLGVQLFDRSRRGITLTPSGEILTNYTRYLLQLAAQTRQAVTNSPPNTEYNQQLHIGASPGVGAYLMPPWINTFHEQYPSFNATLKTATTPAILAFLQRGEIDLAIVEGELSPDIAVRWVPLWGEEILVVVTPDHPWGERNTIRIDELAQERLIVREEGSLTRLWENSLFESHNINPQIVAEFDSPAAIKQAVLTKLGIALLPRFAVRSEQNVGQLHTLRVVQTPPIRTLRLLWQPDRLSKHVVHAFVYHLAREFPHLPLQILDDLYHNGHAAPATDKNIDTAPQVSTVTGMQ